MQTEEFKTEREFNNKFPTKMYICSRCGSLTDNPYQCRECENQSNNFALIDESYQYTILENGKTELIFKPIELFKENNNGKQADK